jgi:hypothetical protein
MNSKYKILLIALLLGSCATKKDAGLEKVQQVSSDTKAEVKVNLDSVCSAKGRRVPLIGEAESVSVDGVGSFKSRIDTGAKTVSVNAKNIKKYLKGGEDYVSFTLVSDAGKSKFFNRKVQKIGKIKSASNKQERYFVLLDLIVEGKKIEVLVNLNDRSRMEYKLLIGRNLLRGNYSVDSGSKDYFKTRKLVDKSAFENTDCSSYKKLIEIGTLENIKVDKKYSLKTRIDTGAARTSIDGYDIKEFKKGKKKYIRFKTRNDQNKVITVEKPMLGKVPVTSATHSKPIMRYLVSYKLTLGNKTKSFKVSLADRKNLKYKLLIGRDFINNVYEVDTSKTYIFKK